MNLRVTIMLACLGLVTTAVTRNSPIDLTNYVEYQASHGGASWRGRAPLDYKVLVDGDWLELNATVKSDRFNSGNLMRDGLASATVFESKTYPEIVFVTLVKTNTLGDGVQELHLTGALSMHGVAKEITTLVILERNSKQLLATGMLKIKLSEYNMTRPMVAGLSINDDVKVTFNIELDSEQMRQVLSYF